MITTAPLPRNGVGMVAHLQLPPAQRGFVGLIEEMTADPDPLQDFFAIQNGAEVVGFFKIDRDFSRIDPRLPPHSHAMRGLLIGGQYQRHGYGAAVLDRLPKDISATYPEIDRLYLRVDTTNQPAIRAYLAHGWAMADLPAVQGRSGPERVMILRLGQADA